MNIFNWYEEIIFEGIKVFSGFSVLVSSVCLCFYPWFCKICENLKKLLSGGVTLFGFFWDIFVFILAVQ